MTDPKQYDMDNKDDLKRWFREMESYLRVSHFLTDGTDRMGRRFAYQGFLDLKEKLLGPSGDRKPTPRQLIAECIACLNGFDVDCDGDCNPPYCVDKKFAKYDYDSKECDHGCELL